MDNGSLLLLSASQIAELVGTDRGAVCRVVENAYRLHDRGETVVPFSQFLRPWSDRSSRFISLSAYLGGTNPAVGSKFVASFPSNLSRGMPRASALVTLCDPCNGRPVAVMEGSRINCLRTAASAAIAARELVPGRPEQIGMIGCGPINLETARFLHDVWPQVSFIVYDVSSETAERFAASLKDHGGRAQVARSLDTPLQAPLVSIGTNATSPTVPHRLTFEPGQTMLHISLRDLTTHQVLAARNVVDDVEHVNREQTSIHLAGVEAGDLKFVAGTIGRILNGGLSPRGDGSKPVVFSPFGLGALDVAVASLICRRAQKVGIGVSLEGFFG